MEPFSLTCRSCAVKLKVENPQLVGQTLACPKCGTMIHVQHPSGWKPAVTDSSQSGSATAVGEDIGGNSFDDVEDLLTNAVAGGPAKPRSKPPRKTSGNGRGQKQAQPQQAARKQKIKTKPSSAAGKAKVAAVGGAGADSPILPGDDWASKAARERKKLFLMIGSAAATVLVVAATIFAIVKMAGGPSEQVVDAGDEVVNPQVEPKKDGAGVDEENKPDTNGANDAIDPVDETKPGIAAADDGFLDETPVGKPATAISQAGALDESPSMAGDLEPGGFAAPSIEDVPNLGNAPSLDVGSAVDAEPNGNDSEQSKSAVAAGIEAAANDSFQAMDQKMGALSGMLADSDTSIRDLQDLSALLSRRETLGMPKYSMEKAKPGRVNFERLLNLPISSVQSAKPVSLAKAMRLLTSLSGVPISIDARQISMMGLPVNPKLELKIEDRTSLSAAQMVAEQVGLKCLAGEASLSISLPAEIENSKAEIQLPKVGELSKEEKARFVGSIKSLIATEIWMQAESPASASIQDDKILLDCPEGVQRHVQMMIDRINAAAVLLQDPDDGPSQQQVASRWASSKNLRQQDSGWTIGRAQTVGNYLDRIERLHGLTVLIDWQAALAVGWSPVTIVPGELVEPTVGESLQELAKSMGLSLVGIDATTVQLTSRDLAASALDLEVYPCGSEWAAGVRSEEVEQLIFRALGGKVSSNFVRIIFEPRCRSVIVVAPQPLQRQVESLVNRLNQAARESKKD